MSAITPPLPPNPSLLAILLVIRTKAGQPRLVFHYPPSTSLASTTQTAPPAHSSWFGGASTGTEGDDSSTEQSSGSDDDTRSGGASHIGSDTDRDEERSKKSGSWRSKRDGSRQHTTGSGPSMVRPGGKRDIDDELEAGSGDEDEDDDEDGRLNGAATGGVRHQNRTGGGRALDWERVLGFDADALGKLLTPSNDFNKRRFEVGIDNIVFLGAPMFAKENGAWRKHKRRKTRASQRKSSLHTSKRTQSPQGDKIDITTEDNLDGAPSSFNSAGNGVDSTSGNASEVASLSDGESQMSMFNIIFVMNPPALEYHLRIDDMYDHIVKRFAKYLKHEQAEHNLVWEESVKIMALKEKARENRAPAYLLWPNIVGSSALAKAMAVMFDAISDSKIAHVNLDKTLDVAFQIPQPESTPFISTATEPQVPGLWLTTAPFVGDDETTPILNPHSALLLLEDKAVLVKEIENETKELADPLIWFINNLAPTKSLKKQFTNSTMAFKDSLFLAQHLIYWRRARAIPPLHHRDTYIVSPNADMRALPAAIQAFAARFPTLPPLPRILQLLSGQPRPYWQLMPSKDHRVAYMDILAWLMRGGWITQLKSFGWVSVPTKVKTAVAQKMATERAAQASRHTKLDAEAVAALNGSDAPAVHGHRATNSTASVESPSSSSMPSPHLTPYRSPSHPASDAGSISSERTTIPYRVRSPSPPPGHGSTLPVRPSPLHIEQQASPAEERAGPSPALSLQSGSLEAVYAIEGAGAAPLTPNVIQSPQKANAIESRWIEQIGSSFADPELTELWPVMLRYFDGRHALDEIALREGLKRKRVATVLAKLKEGGWLLTVRHW